MKLKNKIILSVVLTLITVLIAYIPVLILGLMFMELGIAIGAVVTGYIIISINLRIFNKLSLKKHAIITLLIVLIPSLYLAYTISRQYQFQQVAKVSDKVDLNLYQPHTENNKIVKLSQPSTLKLTDNLPMIDGATALYPAYSAFVEATYPADNYNHYTSIVQCNKTSGAFDRLVSGETDIIFIAKPSSEQSLAANKKGVKLILKPIGYEAFVFFVNSKNPVSNLSVDQIKSIYSGKITNWNKLGGNNKSIKAFQRVEGSGSQTALQDIMKDAKLMKPVSEDVVADMGGIITVTADYRNFEDAIGFSFLYFTTEMFRNNQIKLLSIDGIEPNKANIMSKTYPFISEIYAVTTDKALNTPRKNNIESFLNWVTSPQGQSLLEETGYVGIL